MDVEMDKRRARYNKKSGQKDGELKWSEDKSGLGKNCKYSKMNKNEYRSGLQINSKTGKEVA